MNFCIILLWKRIYFEFLIFLRIIQINEKKIRKKSQKYDAFWKLSGDFDDKIHEREDYKLTSDGTETAGQIPAQMMH